MNKLPERIRIKDIARLADVSVGTVDRVLHGRTGVSEASRKRVEEILKQLDYQQYVCQRIGIQQKVSVCLPAATAQGRRLLDRCGTGDEKSRRNLFGFPHHPVRDVL